MGHHLETLWRDVRYGVRPVIGRTLTDADDQRVCPPVAVITHAFWQSEYGGGADVVGKSVAISGQPFQIVVLTESVLLSLLGAALMPAWRAAQLDPMVALREA